MILSAALVDRVRRLVPMLSSPQDGEVIATRNAIDRALQAGGSDWLGLAASINANDRPQQEPSMEMPFVFGDLCRAVRDLDGGRLSPHERAFVRQMCALGFVRQPTARQHSWMRDIFSALQRRTAA